MISDLLVDGNYLLYKNVYTLHKMRSLYPDLFQAMVVNFEKVYKTFPFNRVYFVSDSNKSSWRKSIYSEYKAGRVKNDDIDWEFVFNIYVEFKDHINKKYKDVIILEEDHIEGDDWIAFIVPENNKKGISNVIVSSDEDLQQLLLYRMSPKYINIQWREAFVKETVFFPHGYQLLLNSLKKDTTSLFTVNNNNDFLSMIDHWYKMAECKEVSPTEILFKKIIMGDKGDNILSVLHKTAKSGKPMGIGKGGIEKIWDNYKDYFSDDIDFIGSDEWIDDSIPFIAENKKIDLTTELADDVKKKIYFNQRLVTLNEKFYPKEIKDKIKSIITKRTLMNDNSVF